MKKTFFVKNLIKERVDQEADIEWAVHDKSHVLPKAIHYPKTNLPKGIQTRKTAFYAFLKQLKP